jgi:hypothetical protein
MKDRGVTCHSAKQKEPKYNPKVVQYTVEKKNSKTVEK